MARLRSGSATNTNRQPWWLEPVGAWSAISRHSSSSSRGTGRLRSRRRRTARVVVRTSSIGDRALPPSSATVAVFLQLVAQGVVALELLQRKRATGALGVLGGVDRLEQQVDLVDGERDPKAWPALLGVTERGQRCRRRRLLHHPWPRRGPEQLLGTGQGGALERAHGLLTGDRAGSLPAPGRPARPPRRRRTGGWTPPPVGTRRNGSSP